MFGLMDVFLKIFKQNKVYSQGGELFKYFLNDPTTPDVYIETLIPSSPGNMSFVVLGYNGESNPTDVISKQAANCQVTVATSLQYIQSILSQFREPLQKWSKTNVLTVVPRAGKSLNAYYDGKNLKFFYDMGSNRKMVFAANSTDAVSHELGHGLLDSLRPDLWDVQSLEAWGFHEAFGDINAMLTLMQFDIVLDKMLQETGGDIKLSNTVSRISEELGNAVFDKTGGRGVLKYGALRDAVNDFKYEKPETLPPKAEPSKLSANAHSFSRVFTGAWYDMFAAIYTVELKNKNNKEALKTARDIAANYLLRAICLTPKTIKFYEAMAKSILIIDKESNSVYSSIIRDVFEKRNILSNEITALSAVCFDDVKLQLRDSDKIIKVADSTVVKINKQTTVRLSDYFRGMSALSVNGFNLNDVEIDVASEMFYEFDSFGNLIDEIKPLQGEILESAQACVGQIKYSNNVDDSEQTMWEVKNGKLLRTFICEPYDEF